MTDARKHCVGAADDTADTIKHAVQQQFGQVAQRYVTSEGHAHGADLTLLVEWLQPSQDWLALDIATGGGHVAKALSPYVNQVIASDLTKVMLQAARQHLMESDCRNVQFVLGDAESLPFLDDTFDVVTCRIAPHHFASPETFVRESWRVLKPGGRFLLIDNVAPDDADLAAFINTVEKLRDKSHVRCASVPEWKTWLNGAGFSLIREHSRTKMFTFQPWVKRMVESDEIIANIEAYLRGADEVTQKHFAILETDGHITSLQVDEWMVMAVKQG